MQVQVDSRVSEALDYARDYEGDFPFMIAMKARYLSRGTFSERMITAILNTKEHDLRRAAMRQTGTGVTVEIEGSIDLRVLPEGRTRYAVPNSEGALTFIQIDRVADRSSRWNGWIFVKQQLSDYTEKRGSQRPGQMYRGVWVSLLQKVLDDPKGAMRAYGENLGICGNCGRTLTNEVSRQFGIGPDCREALGW
jgi:hypothetical protein